MHFFSRGILLAAACATAACSSNSGPLLAAPGVTVAPITVTSQAFSEGGPIPVEHTCDGKDTFPGVTWSSPPFRTRSLVLVVDDPDAPGGTFTHYIVFDLSPKLRALTPDADPGKIGAHIGKNDFDAIRYNGPCPPKRFEHHYRFTIYALDAPLGARDGLSRAALDKAMNGHLLGQGTLTGRFTH